MSFTLDLLQACFLIISRRVQLALYLKRGTSHVPNSM